MSDELRLRILSAIVMAALAIGSAWLGGWVFMAIWGVIALLILQEWLAIIRGKSGFLIWGLGGIVYATMLFFAVIALRQDPNLGFIAILFLFAVVWAADIGAYFAGRAFGGPKLAPRISPKKTWSGMIGGLLAAILAGIALLAAAGQPLRIAHGGIALVLALASVAGDLFESGFKRRFGVKDSGRLIPGHGGFMDRLDGFLFAAAIAVVIGIARRGAPEAAAGLLDW